ncbi:hypothetical protein [Corynebacterium argentoratense]|uniref:hypothetical protein n=1 Tax=Corynebacterium argentoratense TaxID=42817 RepID=UPI00404310CD
MTVRRLWWRKESCSVSGQFIAESTAGGYTTQKDLTNAILKGDDGMRLGSTKARLMRGWIKKFFLAAVGVSAMNLRLIQSWIAGERDVIDGVGRGPGGPGGRPKKERKKFRKRVADIASGNDPPAKVA